jgi:outer membrane receptor for monomeric catechols
MVSRTGAACLTLTVAAGLLWACWPHRAAARTAVGGEEALAQPSLAQLSNLEATSVTKTPQPLSTAPAAVYAITHQQIVRSGASSLPQVLRLAPNLQVTQVTASDYVVSARGFNGAPQAQNFSNKMLIPIGGRSVYSPLYSGVHLDATLRHVSALPNPALPGYWELSARIGWRATRTLELSLSGSNLLHARHLELPLPYGEYIGRSVFLRADWRVR